MALFFASDLVWLPFFLQRKDHQGPCICKHSSEEGSTGPLRLQTLCRGRIYRALAIVNTLQRKGPQSPCNCKHSAEEGSTGPLHSQTLCRGRIHRALAFASTLQKKDPQSPCICKHSAEEGSTEPLRLQTLFAIPPLMCTGRKRNITKLPRLLACPPSSAPAFTQVGSRPT